MFAKPSLIISSSIILFKSFVSFLKAQPNIETLLFEENLRSFIILIVNSENKELRDIQKKYISLSNFSNFLRKYNKANITPKIITEIVATI